MSNTRSPGFTLLEVMVALTVGGIALGSIYAVGSASTRHFRAQQRISAAQTSLRSAMAVLKHDFERAGFLSTPDSRLSGEACAEASTVENRWVGAVNRYVQNATKPTKLDPDDLNTVTDDDGTPFYRGDDVWLTGNFVTSGEYPNINMSADGLTVTIPMGWQSFQRDFAEWNGAAAGQCNEAVFKSVFMVDRLVRLHSMNGAYFYARVASAACVDASAIATVTLKESVPASCGMDGGWIAPVNTLRYHMLNADESKGEDQAGGRNVVLRRTEVDPTNRISVLRATVGTALEDVEDRVLLDHVVRFRVDFLMAEPPPTSPIPSLISYIPMTQAEVIAEPRLIRGVVLDVAVRTPQQEPEFTAGVARSAFQLYAGLGAARVRRMRAELLLRNIADRNR